jgi:hypothetical protein
MREWTINTENNDKIELANLDEYFIDVSISQILI